MQEHKLTLDRLRPFLGKWFARAKYFDDVVLSRLAKAKPKKKSGLLQKSHEKERFPSLAILKVEPEEFSPPHFDEQALAHL